MPPGRLSCQAAAVCLLSSRRGRAQLSAPPPLPHRLVLFGLLFVLSPSFVSFILADTDSWTSLQKHSKPTHQGSDRSGLVGGQGEDVLVPPDCLENVCLRFH